MMYQEGDLGWLFEERDIDIGSSSSDSGSCEEDLFSEIQGNARRRGRPSILGEHPEIAPAIKNYIEQNTAGAHLRRRSNVMYSNGVTLRDIAAHIKGMFGIEISKDTVHRALLPRRRGTISSKRFKCWVPARVPPKKNSGEKVKHKDFHYTSSQVSLVNQFAQMCATETLCLSVDNKMKVEVGNPATSRRNHISKFYLVEDAPNYPDHDFPYRSTKLMPAGYQHRQFHPKRSRSLSPSSRRKPAFLMRNRRSFSVPSKMRILGSSETSKDRIGRSKVNWPRSGPLNVQLYPSRLIESTSVMHMNFLRNLIANLKRERNIFNVVAIADGGPDWSVKGIINLMTFGFLWEFLKLDTFVVQCYAPGHSRFNPIERSWSLLTKLLVSVILPVEIPELDFVIPKDSEDEKWLVVLDNAVKECGKFWHGRQYDSFPITVHPFLSDNPVIESLKSVHETLSKFTNVCKRDLGDYKQLQDKYKLFVKHCNRKPYQIEFVRCLNNDCNHCSLLPLRKNIFLEGIRNLGGTLPAPISSDIHKDHYRSLEEILYLNTSSINPPKKAHINSFNEFGVCEFDTCNYAFFSKADKERHFRLMNHQVARKPRKTVSAKRKTNEKRSNQMKRKTK